LKDVHHWSTKDLDKRLEEAFPSQRVIVPEDSGLSVLKGAVLFGHKPDFISSRISRFTYGVKVAEKYDPTYILLLLDKYV
jgi:hypothetical protein